MWLVPGSREFWASRNDFSKFEKMTPQRAIYLLSGIFYLAQARGDEESYLFFENNFLKSLACSNVYEVYYFEPWRDSAYERGGDARWKFWIKPLKETDLGVAQAFFDP